MNGDHFQLFGSKPISISNKLPVEEFLRPQRRFKHIFNPGNEWMIEELQKEVDERWNRLLELEEITNK